MPVFLSAELHNKYSAGFCAATLHPVFHNVTDLYGELPTKWWHHDEHQSLWEAYTQANRKYANVVLEQYREGEAIWVNGPPAAAATITSVARARTLGSSCTPFRQARSSHALRSSEILRSMSIQTLGFHMFDVRHFCVLSPNASLTWSSQPDGMLGLEYNGRLVHLHLPRRHRACDTGQRARRRALLTTAERLRKPRGRRIVAGVDQPAGSRVCR